MSGMARFHVEIEATNECNTRCLHCPHEAISRPMGKMDWQTYQVVMDPVLAAHPDLSVGYAGMGEPLLNPLIYQFIQYVQKQAFTILTTNAAALTEKNLQRLIESGLDWLTISFNGATPGLYTQMMGGLNFERGQTHLRRAVEMSRGTRMRVLANVSVTEQTKTHLHEIRSYLRDSGVDEIFFSQCHRRGGFLKTGGICHTPDAPVDRYRCDIYEDTLFVDWTGRVLSCCHDLAGSNVIGDFHTDSLEDILEAKTRSAEGGIKFSICKDCNDLYRFSKDPTPDNQGLGDWVYDLYAETAGATRASSSLSEWLFSLYRQEDQLHQLFVRMDGRIAALSDQVEDQKRLNHELRGRIEAIQASQSWRLVQRLGKLKQVLAPAGSRREQVVHRILRKRILAAGSGRAASKENVG